MDWLVIGLIIIITGALVLWWEDRKSSGTGKTYPANNWDVPWGGTPSLSLPQRSAFDDPNVRQALKVGGWLCGLLLLAAIAFGSAGMGSFFGGVGYVLYLLFSPSGIRVIAFAALVMGCIIGFILVCRQLGRENSQRACGAITVILWCMAGYGGFTGAFPFNVALVMGLAGLPFLALAGMIEAIWIDPPPPPPPPPAPPIFPVHTPTPDIHGISRAATREEAHQALSGLGNASGNNLIGYGAAPQQRYRYED